MTSVQSTKIHRMWITHLTKGPQEAWVGYHDDGERHSKANAEVNDNVGHVPSVPAVPVRGTWSFYPLKLITTPSEQRWGVPHEWPHPGQHHSSNCMSEGHRDGVIHSGGTSSVESLCVMNSSDILPGLEEDSTHGITHYYVALNRNNSYCTETCYTWKKKKELWKGKRAAGVQLCFQILLI